MDETRPSRWSGVTVWRTVVVLTTHTIGPAPMRKKLKPASQPDSTKIVNTITSAATEPETGPTELHRCLIIDAEGWEASTIGRVDNSLWQSDRLTMVIAPAVPLGSFDALPVASPRRGIGERDDLSSRQTT
jgi:hypothetical protein